MISESLSSLSPLESFDKAVFVGDKEYNQDLCNFILALSLIWNDMKNILLYHEYIISLQSEYPEVEKPEDMPITPFWGEVAGIKIYLEKVLVALVHELFSLIRKSKDVIESTGFKGICRQLHKNSRNSWQIILKYSFGEADSKTPLGKALLMVRHKIANHYDKDEIFKGYQRKFIDSENIPFISRGNNMAEKRFYFADASAQEYYVSFQEKISKDEFYLSLNLIKDSINFAIQNIVETFIQKRSAWRSLK